MRRRRKMKKVNSERRISANKVHQWLREWDKVKFDDDQYRRKPEPFFYLFSLSADELKALSGIYRRPTEDGLLREDNLNIQRRHNKVRSNQIRKFVQDGYPLSEISEKQKKLKKYDDLRKPGWLPTAIVINILREDDKRQDKTVDRNDLVFINHIDASKAEVILPKSFTGSKWMPSGIHPIEVIDGQHRLWAFEGSEIDGKFELPVVAFYGLDISWQAYLFWAINIKPKRINASLDFDLYPLLRTEDWLEKFEGPKVYRETRAQEITEALWSYSESAWYRRIDMLGEQRQTMVSQAAWINSLLSTYIKSWEGRTSGGIGGLYGAPVGRDELVLPWTRAQQAAFIIHLWNVLADVIKKSQHHWAEELRKEEQKSFFDEGKDKAFAGSSSLLNTDQGVRGVLYISNDIAYVLSEIGELPLHSWQYENIDETDSESSTISESNLRGALESLASEKMLNDFIYKLADHLSSFDWRSASSKTLSDDEKTAKLVFRGSGGYRELRRQLLNHLTKYEDNISSAATIVYKRLGF